MTHDPQDFEMILEGEFARIDEVPKFRPCLEPAKTAFKCRSFKY